LTEVLEETELEAVVTKVWQEVAAGRSSSVSEAVDTLWPLELGDDLHDKMLRRGLISMVHEAQANRRRTGRPAIAFGRPHGRNWKPYMATLSTPFEGAEGVEKALWDFNVADWSMFVARCTLIGNGWMQRARAGKLVLKRLEEHNVAATRELPVDVLEEVAARFDEVLR
jgi:hypothetical protein